MPTTKLGQPCWDKENVEQAIRPIARTDDEGVDYFLASHAPVHNIRQDETGEEFTEELLFKALFSSKTEVLALVHGDPGAGKSHLIHWLKLRTEDALRLGEIKKIVPVLIERRTGSLKDALEQMIEQLDDEFKHYLTPVQEALSELSADTAREKLVNNIGLELRAPRRAEKKREPLPRKLKDLAEICSGSKGFRDWLCRENGTINAVVKHLTEKNLTETGDVGDAGELPQFSGEEFLPNDKYNKVGDNTQLVRDLIDEFWFEQELTEDAAKFFNEVLTDSIKEMTGLAGTSLRDIFDRIRADLKKRGETLALFIEDVSVMSALDEEVFTAVEPQTRQDLCRLIAVLGSTNEGWNRLPDNQKQRITHPISLGGKATTNWLTDAQNVAEFAARYLNTVRLTREQINSVAAHRRDGGSDVNISACDYCPVREECHKKFGEILIGNVNIGLFPFSEIAPQRLLNDLSSKSAAQKNARGLLTRILLPALDGNYESLQRGNFPNADKFAVVRHDASFWGPFKQMYCGSWKEPEIRRLEFLAQGWVKAENADELAVRLSPFLAPLGFPEFSKRAKVSSKTITSPTTEKSREIPKTVEPVTNTKLDKLLQNLKSWVDGDELSPDVEPRQLLAGLIRKSIAWNDFTQPPLEEWRKVFGGATDDESSTRPSSYGFIKIAGQRSEPATVSLFVDFPRNEETRSLIEALARFTHSGGNSWNFEHAEYHKRIVSQWLRRHESQIIKQLQPPDELDTNAPIASAVQILATAALVRQRAKLSPDLTELLKSIFTENWTEEPFALSNEWKALAKDMQIKHKEVLRFLANELNVPQGRTGGINFINAIPALTAALSFAAAPDIQIPSDDYFQRFWKSRYAIFQNKAKYTNFLDALQAERAALDETVESIKSALKRLDYDTETQDVLTAFCEDFIELLKAQVDAKETEYFAPLNDLGGAKFFASRKEVWQTAFKRAQTVVADEDAIQTLTFNPQTLEEAKNSVLIALDYISRVDNYVSSRLQQFEDEGDPDLLRTALLDSLEKIGKIVKLNYE